MNDGPYHYIVGRFRTEQIAETVADAINHYGRWHATTRDELSVLIPGSCLPEIEDYMKGFVDGFLRGKFPGEICFRD